VAAEGGAVVFGARREDAGDKVAAGIRDGGGRALDFGSLPATGR
jgi:hypothetical protein